MGEKEAIFTKEDQVAVLTMNRPQCLNAINEQLMNEMREAIEVVRKDEDIHALVLTGAGRGFCSGADLREMEKLIHEGEKGKTLLEINTKRAIYYQESFTFQLIDSLIRLEKPVIAAVNGPAVGGGCDIALSCDIRIASDKALFGELYVKRGILADEGGIFLLPKAVGMGWAAELLFSGDTIDATLAERIGLVNRVVHHDILMDAAMELASRIARNSPLAVRMAKRALFWNQRVSEFDRSYQYAAAVSNVLIQTEEHRKGVETFTKKKD